jgi:hypothetical protein
MLALQPKAMPIFLQCRTPSTALALDTRLSAALSLSHSSTLSPEPLFTSHQMHFDPIDFLVKLITTLAIFAVWNVPALFDLIWP